MTLAEELTIMVDSAMTILDSDNITDETALSAEDCIQSLLKSMAVYGFDKVQEK